MIGKNFNDLFERGVECVDFKVSKCVCYVVLVANECVASKLRSRKVGVICKLNIEKVYECCENMHVRDRF